MPLFGVAARAARLLVAVFSITSAALPAPALSAEPPDLNGTWVLEPLQSQDPAEVLSEAGGASSQGAGQAVKRVLRGINIFGVPVGSLPLPSKQEEEPDDDELAYLERLLAATELGILQESSATEFDYKPGDFATYGHGIEVETDMASVVADWRNEIFEISHDLSTGTKILESFVLEPTGALRWTVQIKRKREQAVDIMRVFTRKTGGALRFASTH
jgi:hypothetical protein